MNLEIAKQQCASTGRTFTVGAKCYLDTFSGMVPCVVVGVLRESHGFIVGDRNAVSVRLTADRGAYKRGELIHTSASNVIPRKMRFVRCGQYRVDTIYRFIP